MAIQIKKMFFDNIPWLVADSTDLQHRLNNVILLASTGGEKTTWQRTAIRNGLGALGIGAVAMDTG